MQQIDDLSADRVPLTPAAALMVAGAVLIVFTFDPQIGSVLSLAAVALFAARAHVWWLSATAAAWMAAFTAVLIFPGPYDSSAGPAVVPVLAVFVACFLGGWAVGRKVQLARRVRKAMPIVEADEPPADIAGQPASTRRPQLVWPGERRLRLYLGVVFLVALASAIMRFQNTLPPVFADNPDAARAIMSQQDDIYTGLLGQTWTVGLAVALLRAVSGDARGRWFYILLSLAFVFGAALGASKNAVLVGIVPALIAALSTRRPASHKQPMVRAPIVVALIGVIAIILAVVLGGQRTLAGEGLFEDEFRARYGDNVVAASVASLDLSLSSSTETFGRLWEQRQAVPPGHGAYSVKFLGGPGEAIVGHTDLYLITSQLSMPYYMNTATFVAIPLLDFGPAGAAIYLALLGLLVGMVDRRLEFSTGPAQQLGRAFVVYYAAFGIYELYAAIQPFWLGLAPGLIVLYLTGRSRRAS
ncbi:oligosaccharide repeat unit polymerase [Dactylosporangium roseum]|uniref:Oligosaccharide repeat unit polymerase n=1 Tax=Dactylosporangium roseum TaxID=47989 RepID=A0ABY5Z4A7_9ACTN|nr:O-antigen polymerase [Dactylosporangium roseum]UWZ36876.1 oligosaccharide repeat unit polymerase [Dactylosporangium roseum]